MKLSIITVCRNDRTGLESTLKSVAGQTDKDFEYVVIDGASTDGSQQLIEKYGNIIDHAVSEPDSGIYSAMNKGIKMAHGDYCLFLNAGDTLHDPEVAAWFNSRQTIADVLVGRQRYISDRRREHISPMIDVDKLTALDIINRSLPHQATFIRRELLLAHPYDESKKIVSDWKFWLETLCLREGSMESADRIIADFDRSGISNTQVRLSLQERKECLDELFPARIVKDYAVIDHRMLKLVELTSGHRRIRNFAYRLCKILIKGFRP